MVAVTFGLADAVESLDYDFRPRVDAAGTIREPHDDRLRAFDVALRDLAEATSGARPASRSGALQALGDADLTAFAAVDGRMTDALADVCDGEPTREQIAGLPLPLRVAFLGWLAGILFRYGQGAQDDLAGLAASLRIQGEG